MGRGAVKEPARHASLAFGNAEVRHGARWLLYLVLVGVIARAAALLFDFMSTAAGNLFLRQIAHWWPQRPGRTA
jgi:hypothetical protein